MSSSEGASVLATFREQGFRLALAESLTGGLVTAEFISVPGASDVVLGGIVAYQTELKHELLGVSKTLLQKQGAVDPEVVTQMAAGVRASMASKMKLDYADVVGLANTGVAGPDMQDGKSVGTVFLGVSSAGGDYVYELQLVGDRDSIRRQTVAHSVQFLKEHLQSILQP